MERERLSQEIASALAHELRNPVFAIASAAQLLRYRVGDDPVVEKNLGRILREAERLNGLVTALLDYGRTAPVRLATGDPDDVWQDVLQSHRGELESKSILVRHSPCAQRASCDIDAEQLAQAFWIGLVNAIEAAPVGTDLTIDSSLGESGDWVSRLHNEGPPVPEDVLPRVFEPLVGTKAGHPGMGLALARRIITDHGGTISILSPDGNGTTLAYTLPPSRVP